MEHAAIQPGLFDATAGVPGPRVLISDEEGGARYLPGVVAATRAQDWFEVLQQDIEWKSQRRMMYERMVEVPRLVASWWLDHPELPPVLREAQQAVRAVVDAPFTAVGLNFYRDGDDSVAPHGDKLHMLVPGHPIALLSLGHPRRMSIRANAPPRRSLQVDLEPGSVLVMSHRAQLTHEHGIAKTRSPVGPRISLAFRVRPPRDA